jgi:hypothetical protein
MIGGRKPSEAIVQNAREMLQEQVLQGQKGQTNLF